MTHQDRMHCLKQRGSIPHTIRQDYKNGYLKLAAILVTTIAMTMDISAQPSNRRYTSVPGGYVMVLKEGDSLFQKLEEFAREAKVPSASFTGFGFVNITFGFFNAETKTYLPREFREVELAGMNGSIAWKDNIPSIHAHGVIGDKSFNAHAGHILKAVVSTGSLEIMINVHNKKFERRKDDRLGADVLDIEQ